MKLFCVSISMAGLIFSAQSHAASVRCDVQLGTTGDPCNYQHLWVGPACTFYPTGIAAVELNLVGGNGTGSVVYEGRSYALTCKLFNPSNGSFTCDSDRFKVAGTPGEELDVYSDDNVLTGETDHCY